MKQNNLICYGELNIKTEVLPLHGLCCGIKKFLSIIIVQEPSSHTVIFVYHQDFLILVGVIYLKIPIHDIVAELTAFLLSLSLKKCTHLSLLIFLQEAVPDEIIHLSSV